MTLPRIMFCFTAIGAFTFSGCENIDVSIARGGRPNSSNSTSSNSTLPDGFNFPSTDVLTSTPAEPSDEEDDIRNISFVDLEFDIEPDAPFNRDLLTDEIKALDGKRISLRGFMLPSYTADGIEEFVLVRDNQICCFGPGAKIYHNSMIEMVPGRSASYTTRVVIINGVFHIDEFALDGVVYSCFRIVATSVRGL